METKKKKFIRTFAETEKGDVLEVFNKAGFEDPETDEFAHDVLKVCIHENKARAHGEKLPYSTPQKYIEWLFTQKFEIEHSNVPELFTVLKETVRTHQLIGDAAEMLRRQLMQSITMMEQNEAKRFGYPENWVDDEAYKYVGYPLLLHLRAIAELSYKMAHTVTDINSELPMWADSVTTERTPQTPTLREEEAPVEEMIPPPLASQPTQEKKKGVLGKFRRR